MTSRLVLLAVFLGLPIVELAVLIEVGRHLGTGWTVAIILATGGSGAWLTRQQGLRTWTRLRSDLDRGRFPGAPIVDGVLILLAGALLLTPGVLTDLVGFVLLVPACRRRARRWLRARFEQALRDGSVQVSTAGRAWSRSSRLKNVTPRSPGEPEPRDPRP